MAIASAAGFISLLGSPSDIYGGATIGITLRDMQTYVFVGEHDEGQHFHNRYFDPGIKRTNEHIKLYYAVLEHFDLQYRQLSIKTCSDIPEELGASRSVALTVALIRALQLHFDIGMYDNAQITEAAWSIIRKLEVIGGEAPYAVANDDEAPPEQIIFKRIKENADKKLKDITTAKLGKLYYMDFSGRELLRTQNMFSSVIQLPLPSMHLALAVNGKHESLPESMRIVYENNEKKRDTINELMQDSGKLARLGAQEFNKEKPNIKKIGQLMTKSHDNCLELMKKLGADVSDGVKDMRSIALRTGAIDLIQAGHGSIAVLYTDDKVVGALQKKGYHVILLSGGAA